MSRIILISILTIIIISNSSFSEQFSGGLIKGFVTDSITKTPLPFANITIHKASDSSYIMGIASGTEGEFSLNQIPEGDYFVKVSYLGYQNKIINGLKVSSNTKEKNLGVIALLKENVELQEAEITGQRAVEELHLDKKIINVSQDLNASGGTALNVLENQPSVRVDADGTVYLRGSSNFTILIDGKPNTFQGSDALRQISANSIETIELITNPSSRYDAEGSSGIININLKKLSSQTFSGIANVNAGTKDKYNSDFNFNYSINGIKLNGGIDYRNNYYPFTQEIDRSSSSSPGMMSNFTRINIFQKNEQLSGRGGIDYNIDPQNSFSFFLSGGRLNVNNTFNSVIENITPSNHFFGNNINGTEIPISYINSVVNYLYKPVPGVNEISLEMFYSNVNVPQEQELYEYTTDGTFQNRNPEPGITRIFNDAKRNEGRGKLNFSHSINEKSKLETGLQANLSYRSYDLVNKFYDWNNSAFVINDLLTNNYEYKNNVYSAFASFTGEFKGFNFMAGLRGEYMDRLLTQKTESGSYAYDKMDLFPSINISRNIDDHQIQFSYSRRINRPHDNMLNPFPFYNDAYLSTSGNPYLLPEYINSFELNYQKVFDKIYFSAQTFYRQSDQAFLQHFVIDENGKLFTTFGNFGSTQIFGTELSASIPVFEIIKLDPALSLTSNGADGVVHGRIINESYFNWNGRLNASISFTQDLRMQIGGHYWGRNMTPQGEYAPVFNLTASIRQELFDKKLSVTLQGRNLLKTSNYSLESKGANYTGTLYIYHEVPVVSLMLSYNFNNFKRTNRPSENIDVPTGI
jgi:outer membrane receptor protein involved in Fe transport